MNLNVQFSGEVAVVELRAEALNASNCGDFRASLSAAVGNSRHVALDLGSVRAIDSAGIGALISALRALRALGGDLKLFAVTESVLSALALVRLDRVFTRLPSRDEAVADFAAER